MGVPGSAEEARGELVFAALVLALLVGVVIVLANVFTSDEGRKPHELRANSQERWVRSLPAWQASDAEHGQAASTISRSAMTCDSLADYGGGVRDYATGTGAAEEPEDFVLMQVGIYIHCPEHVDELEDWVSSQRRETPYWVTNPRTNLAD
ncbi:MAG: hypothetical protein Q4F53_03300 [Nesterenkonia sp.]|uniref:hypothetical protein n=1 Tax=Nesterenkonia marinintestina TaxID=2979865 RepID=UPI0021BF2A71|nr:hypothetical protein [Nesterenkonia sp. GX14115]MDO5492625.1 hypothetical protein [Nesterenkonia sp.]